MENELRDYSDAKVPILEIVLQTSVSSQSVRSYIRVSKGWKVVAAPRSQYNNKTQGRFRFRLREWLYQDRVSRNPLAKE